MADTPDTPAPARLPNARSRGASKPALLLAFAAGAAACWLVMESGRARPLEASLEASLEAPAATSTTTR